jgi:hypothetical protein
MRLKPVQPLSRSSVKKELDCLPAWTILDHPELGKIDDPYRKAVTTVLLERQE